MPARRDWWAACRWLLTAVMIDAATVAAESPAWYGTAMWPAATPSLWPNALSRSNSKVTVLWPSPTVNVCPSVKLVPATLWIPRPLPTMRIGVAGLGLSRAAAMLLNGVAAAPRGVQYGVLYGRRRLIDVQSIR